MKKFRFPGNLIFRLGILLLFLVITNSCEKEQFDEDQMNEQELKSGEIVQVSTIDYFSETFTITTKDALIAERVLSNPDFSNYENFTILVRNGKSGKTKVTRMEIRVDKKTVITYKDFKKNASVVTKPLPGLTANSKLYVKIEGSRGRFITVTVKASSRMSSLNDIEGNVYRTVKIGDQWWMAENLKTTKLNDGTSIPVINGNFEWLSKAGDYLLAMSWYGNDPGNKSVYGALYNWAAAGSGKLCPVGWHVPESEDYCELTLFIDPDAVIGYYSAIAGGALKEKGTEHWESPNEGATDEFGFTALPGGIRNVAGEFAYLGLNGSWWSDDGLSSISMSYSHTGASFSEGGNEYGRSVRCVKN